MALALGSDAVAFSLPGVDGKTHSLADYDGKQAVAVIFSCNHCPYVLAWEDRLIALQTAYADQGVQFIAINANDAEKYPADSFDAMKTHAEEKNFPYPYLYDESQDVAQAYGAERTPEVFLFDSDMKLKYHGTVDDNYEDPAAVSETYLKDALEALVQGTNPAHAETDPVGCTIKWR